MRRGFVLLCILIVIAIAGLFQSCDNSVAPNDPVDFGITEPSWVQTLGPCGGYIPTISINSHGHIFAGVWRKFGNHYQGDGLYRSMDNCNSWLDLGLESGMGFSVFSSVINSRGHVFIYSAGAIPTGAGVYRSLNNGKSWTYAGTDEMDRFIVMSFVVNSDDHIFAVAGPAYPDGDVGGIYRSTDNGASWVKVTDFEAGFLAINSQGYLFAVTSAGMYNSTDNGNNWTLITDSMTIPSIYSLTINLNDHIFAGTFSDGVFRSIDSGESWEQINNGLGSDPILSFAINGEGDIFAGSDRCIFRSADNGDSWTRLRNNILNSTVFSIAVNPSGHIYAGTGSDGIIRSTDNGDDWEVVGAPIADVNYLAVNPSDHIFAKTDFGLFRSLDSGNSWQKLGFDGSIKVISSDGVLYANGVNDEIWGLWRSTDNGDSWVLANTVTYSPIAISSNGYLFGCAGTDGVFRSVDNGESWEQINNGLVDVYITNIAIDMNDYVFASSSLRPPPPFTSDGIKGIFRSMDNGDSWKFLAGPNGSLMINSSGDIFVYGPNGICRSTNNGDDWDIVNAVFPANSLVINSIGTIYAGGLGVYYSTNNGDNWRSANEGLATLTINCLTINSTDVVFSGSNYCGVYRLDDHTN